MTREMRITALPEDEAHPDHVIASIEVSIARIDGARLLAHWTDATAGAGDTELAIRVAVRLESGRAGGTLEQSIVDDLRRRRLPCSVNARPVEASPIGSDTESRHTIRDDVRRLVHLVPRGRVTTVDAIGTWIETDTERVAAALDELVAMSRGALPWHRITAADGWLDTTHGVTRARAQAVRLEADAVPVRHERVVGFHARFVDVVRLGTNDGQRFG